MELTLLIHPQWLEGCPKRDEQGREYGGSATDSVEATIRWDNARAAQLRLLEVRGTLPEQVTCPETGVTLRTDTKGGTSAKAGKFTCRQETCGTEQSIVSAAEATGKSAPWAASAIHGYSPTAMLREYPTVDAFLPSPTQSSSTRLSTSGRKEKTQT